MSPAEIDNLIGGRYQATVVRPVLNKPQAPAPAKKALDPDRCQFISGPKSQFLTERSMSPLFTEALMRHEEGVRVRREKLKSSMLTLTVPPKRRSAFLRSLKRKTDSLRSFMVDELAVFELALSTALAEMKDELEQLTGSRVEKLTVARIERAAESLVDMHATTKLASILGVSGDIKKLVLQSLGTPDGQGQKPRANMLDLQALLAMQQARKGAEQHMQGVVKPQAPNHHNRTPGEPRWSRGAARVRE